MIRDAFRRWGYLQANLDSLDRLKPQAHPDLDGVSDPAREIYCGSIGAEFMHLSPQRAEWVAARMESAPTAPDRIRILRRLIEAETFEQVTQTRYLGAKRYSLEGATALIPLLDEILEGAAERGARQAVLAMSHRGRINVMVNVLGKNPADIFAGFEDVDPRRILGAGDVKYHNGATGDFLARQRGPVRISLVSNASHLEAVNPVAMGRARAKQEHFGAEGRASLVPITIHGDAAFAGQGITAETLNLADLHGFSVGGTIHVIVNNLIGFTTTPGALHSARFSSDLAKRQEVPVFHVNGEDPEAVVRAARIALEYRYTFWSDAVVDLIGYRRHGHSEVDDPTITQPILYRKIQNLPLLWKSYAQTIGHDWDNVAAMQQAVRRRLDDGQAEARSMQTAPSLRQLPDYWSAFRGGAYEASLEVDTGVSLDRLQEVGNRITSYPADLHIHPKVKRMLEERKEMLANHRSLDWGMAEALAFGTLLWDGTRVRLAGEDSRRGTFNQRQSVLVDTQTEAEHIPLCDLRPGQGIFEVYDTCLSEAAALGFEYGFSRDFPEALVLWEAQFGDFVNGAQIVIDQFVSAAEDKWGLLSGLVMLLPHGYEGQGPEHSSARLERFLQLCAEDNMQVAQPSTAAQYFHLLRRQALRKWRKPLVVFTPKGMLRHPRAISPLTELTRPRFLPVLPDESVGEAARILVCSGKIGHELRAEREKRGDSKTAIVLLEKIYPFPETELAAEIARHGAARDVVWVQEEPANMGALFFVLPRIERAAGSLPVRSVKRSASASPATGSGKAHAIEQAALIGIAFA